MSQSKQYHNPPFLLENRTLDSIRDKAVNMMFTAGEEKFYDTLLVFDKTQFDSKITSVSNFYRSLSNSNQTVARTTNREWWNSHFAGGEYAVYICENKIAIHFMLELRHISRPVNELQLRIRLAKASKGLKYQILLNDKTTLIEKALDSFKDCISEVRLIGKNYKENVHNSVIIKRSDSHL